MTHSSISASERARRRVAIAGASAFLIALAAPGALHLTRALTGGAPADLGENRPLAPWPAPPADLAALRAYPDAAGAYLEDRFGLRAPLVAAYVALARKLGGAGAPVIVGRDGWLFYARDRVVESYRGLRPPSRTWADGWFAEVERLRDAATARGGSFFVLLLPNKVRVYPEHMPDGFGSPSSARRLDALRADPRARGAGWVEAEAAVLAARAEGQVYRRHDTHWTSRGAFAAYRALMDAVIADRPEISALDWSDLRAVTARHAEGDLARMLAFGADVEEVVDDVAAPASVSNAPPQVLDDDEQPAFRTRVYAGRADAGARVLVIGDSFADALIPYLRASFSEVIVAHHRLGRADLADVLDMGADVVVLEMVERYGEGTLAFEGVGRRERVSSAP